MIKESLANSCFKNERVIFKSYIKEFTNALYEEFELNAKKNRIAVKDR